MKARALVKWNTGQRVHRPKKGKGSYRREKISSTKGKGMLAHPS